MSEIFREYGSILPCGGKGSRLASLTGEKPKSLYEVGGQELIRYSTNVLRPEIVNRIVFAIGHGGELIKEWVRASGLQHITSFSEQVEPGILGAIVAGSNQVEEDSVVTCNTDEVRCGLDLYDVVTFHEAQGTLATMVVTVADNLSRHRLVEVNERGLITSSRLKPEEFKAKPDEFGLVNTGFLIIEKDAIDFFEPGHSTDWSGIIDPLCEEGQLSAYINPDIAYFNVGTPEEYRDAEAYLEQDARNS